MSNINELARELNNHKNKSRIGATVGEVIRLLPLVVNICGGRVHLREGDELTLCETLRNKNLHVGDLVFVVPNEGEQSWIGVDRIG